MYNSDLASDIEKAVQDALATSDFSKLNKDITSAVNTSIAQIGTNQNRFHEQYGDDETTAERLEHIDGEIVNGDARADYNARRKAAQAEAERARYNSRQAVEARRRAAEERRSRAAQERRRQAEESRNQTWQAGGGHTHGQHGQHASSSRLREAAEAFGFFGSQTAHRGNAGKGSGPAGNANFSGSSNQNYGAYAPRQQNSTQLVPISRKPKGRVSGTLLSVFGWLGLATCVMLLIMFSLMNGTNAISYSSYDAVMGSLVMPGFFISGGMTVIGTKRRHRIHRFYQYVRQLRGRAYCPVKELSSHIGRSERFVVKDLRKMIALGMFPEGHIDDQQTCVMLNGATYDQYLKAQNAYLARQMEEKRAGGRIASAAGDFATAGYHAGGAAYQDPSDHNASGMEPEPKEEAAAAASSEAKAANPGRAFLPPKVIKVLSAGDSYLTKIREANAAIPGEIISAKLDRLEEIIRKIYARIEEHPEQVDDLDKFINYYLPTTLKLVDAYRDFDAQSVQGDNIKTAKKEIESTLETIIYAFETLLDSLYEDDALDISTDISVLQTMFAQEGLTRGAFDKVE